MELKPYQQDVISDLVSFLNLWSSSQKKSLSYTQHWEKKGYCIQDSPSAQNSNYLIAPYQGNELNSPNVCIKVPTAGGKTFIACNALKEIFALKFSDLPKVVLWFVPSRSILDQTLKNLKNPTHPYRLLLNSHFQNRVQVFSKEDVLFGNGFQPVSILENLNIIVRNCSP